MSEATTATWRFALGQQVRWAGDGHVCMIWARRWIERDRSTPYAEYQVERPYVGTLWVVEADMDELFPEPPAGEEER